jgi:uroporphyrinogen-III synthase
VNELSPVLAGCRILVTAQRRADELGAALARRGAEVVHAPTLGVVARIDEADLVRRTAELSAAPPDLVVVTTGVGFRGWLETAEAAGLGEQLLQALAGTRLVARGPKAQGALQAAGLRADWVAESETSAEIIDFLLAEGVADLRIAVQHHGAGDPAIEDAFARAGARVVPLDVYRWGPPQDPLAVVEAARAAGAGHFDAVLFTSAPAAQAWLDSLDCAGTRPAVAAQVERGRLLLAAVGPVTAEPLAFAGMVARRPVRSRMGALVRLVMTELGADERALATPQGRLRIRAGAVTLDHRPVPVTPTGLAVLRRLADTPGRVVSREELLRVLPGESTDPHTAEVAVARLRESLKGATAGADRGQAGVRARCWMRPVVRASSP